MSSTNEEIETKAGHPPALKVGGVRIAQRVRKDSEESKSKDKAEKPTEEVQGNSFGLFKPPVLVTGVPAKIEQQRDHPKEEIRHAHEKPIPTHQPIHQHKPAVIQQPRK